MAKLIWFNQPTNHSGWANLLYFMPDSDVGKVEKLGIEASDSVGTDCRGQSSYNQ